MIVSVKICGISTEDALDTAIDAGADYAGFVFFERSPRHLPLDRAEALARRAAGRIKTVALTVNAGGDAIKTILDRVQPDFLQLHGEESVERMIEIRHFSAARIIKAIKVGAPDDIEAGRRAYEAEADVLLFDAQASAVPDALPGGNGLSFDWRWLPRAGLRPDFMLSGGLCAENVLSALDASGARAVDVSSGVEAAPGVKDPALIRRFIETVKSCQCVSPVPAAVE
jgi:phosphoribosylanthranilate isomerase